MAWNEGPTAWRTAPRPTGWKALRAQAMARDGGQCTWTDDGQRCDRPGTDCDHIGDPADHSLSNLRMLCSYHHRRRTALQARRARGPQPSRARPHEQHPGLIATTEHSTRSTASSKQNVTDTERDEPPF